MSAMTQTAFCSVIATPLGSGRATHTAAPARAAAPVPSVAAALASASLRAAKGQPARQFFAARRPKLLAAGRARFLTTALTSSEVDPVSYIQENAAIPAPQLLPTLVKLLEVKGEEVVSPAERAGLHPLVVPLSRNAAGDMTGILRWPSSPGGGDMPIVRAGQYGLTLVANSASEYIHRALVEEDLELNGKEGPVRMAAGAEAANLYPLGEISGQKRPEVFLVQKVGKFPDVMEGLARGHLEKGDVTSALVTAEWMCGHMPQWGYAPAMHANLLKDLDRMDEARDQARIALSAPWWTLGHPFEEMIDIAGFAGKEHTWVRENLKGQMALREAQLNGTLGADQAPQQTPEEIALEEAEMLLDMAHVSGDWDAVRADLISKYMAAGLNKVAFFVSAIGNRN